MYIGILYRIPIQKRVKVYNNKLRFSLLSLPILPNNTDSALLANLPVRLNRLAATTGRRRRRRRFSKRVKTTTPAYSTRRRSARRQRFSNQPATDHDGRVPCVCYRARHIVSCVQRACDEVL